MSESPKRRKLHLRPDVAVVSMEAGVQLRAGDEGIYIIETELPKVVETLLQSMTKGADRPSLENAVGEGNGELIDSVIQQLAAARLLLEQPIEPDDRIGRYLAHFVHDGLCPPQRPTGPVAVTGCIESARLLARAINEHGIQVITIESNPSLDETAVPRADAVVCIWEQPNLRRILRVNDVVCRWRMPCLFVDLSHGQHATLGPFYIPGEGACYRCYRKRWRENTATLAEFEAAESAVLDDGETLPAYGILPAFRYHAVGTACAELFAFLARHRSLQTLNRVATIDLEGMQQWTEPCWQIPWCPACGTSG